MENNDSEVINAHNNKKNCENIHILSYKELAKNQWIGKVLGKPERPIYILWNTCSREKVNLYTILYVEKFGVLEVEDHKMHVFGK